MDRRNLGNQTQKKPIRRKLDLLFIQDTTGSQQRYIQASTERCKEVAITLHNSSQLEPKGLRLGLVAFRDHGDDYIVEDFGGFIDSVDNLKSNLSTLSAAGGGDGPEAVARALQRALALQWREDAAKLAVLITDAPPHGIGESGDNYPDGEPYDSGERESADPLLLARQMQKRGIRLLVIACEPVLSNGYDFAHDFYMALAKTTYGIMLPLTRPEVLAPLVVGFALQNITIESLISQFRPMVTSLHEEGMSVPDIISQLSDLLRSMKTQIVSLQSSPVYSDFKGSVDAVSIWMQAENTASAKKALLASGIARGVLRVPENSPSPSPSPLWIMKYRIPITLRNTRDFFIQFSYVDEGEEKRGTLTPVQILPQPVELLLSNPYLFTLVVGRTRKETSRTFIREEDWDISIFFD